MICRLLKLMLVMWMKTDCYVCGKNLKISDGRRYFGLDGILTWFFEENALKKERLCKPCILNREVNFYSADKVEGNRT